MASAYPKSPKPPKPSSKYKIFNINLHGMFVNFDEHEYVGEEDIPLTFEPSKSYVFFMGRLGRSSADIPGIELPQLLLKTPFNAQLLLHRFSYHPKSIVQHGYLHMFCPGNVVPNQNLSYDKKLPHMIVYDHSGSPMDPRLFRQDRHPRKSKYKKNPEYFDYLLNRIVGVIESSVNDGEIPVIFITNCLVVNKNLQERLLENESERALWTHAWKESLARGYDFLDVLAKKRVLPNIKFIDEINSVETKNFKDTAVSSIHAEEEEECINDAELLRLFEVRGKRYIPPLEPEEMETCNFSSLASFLFGLESPTAALKKSKKTA